MEKEQAIITSYLGPPVHEIMRNFLLILLINGVVFAFWFSTLIPWSQVLKIV